MEIREPISDTLLPRAAEGYAGLANVRMLPWHITVTRARMPDGSDAVRVVVRPALEAHELLPGLDTPL